MHPIIHSSMAKAWLLGLAGLLGSGALATGLGYAAQVAMVSIGFAG